MVQAIGRLAQLLPPLRRIGVRAHESDGTDGLEERSARDDLSQIQCRVGWSPRISRTPLGFELSAPFVFSDTTGAQKSFLRTHHSGFDISPDYRFRVKGLSTFRSSNRLPCCMSSLIRSSQPDSNAARTINASQKEVFSFSCNAIAAKIMDGSS